MSETIEKNLNVPYWKSEQAFYCSEASAQMFLDYYGYKLGQEYIHQYADRFEVLLPFLNKYVRVIELIPNKPLIINSINNKNPVILRVHNKYLHTIVVIGYTTNDFIIHDPDQRANIYINQDKLVDISEKIILKRKKMSEIEDLEKQLADLKRQREEEGPPSSEIDRYLYLRARKEEMGTDLDEVERELSKLEDTEAIQNYEPMTHKEFLAAVKACVAKPKHEIKECIEEELKPACPECNIKKTEEEPCPACEFAVGIGMYLNVYRDLDSEENCQDLFEKVTSGEITPEEFFNIIKEKAKDKPEKLGILGYIDELMEGANSEGESQKERI